MTGTRRGVSQLVYLAHGVGTRTDLPIPTSLAALGAGLAVLISFAAVAVLWRQPRLAGSAAGRPLPRPLAAVLDSPAVRLALRLAAAAVVVLVCVVGLAGPDNVARNIAPWAFYVTFWVGLVPASLLFGPVWRLLNPLRLLPAGLYRLLGRRPGHGLVALPAAVGYWPAVLSLAAFAWLELVYPDRSEPRAVTAFILGYAAVHTVAGLVFGQRWFDRGDGFEVYSTLLGSLAPLGRRADGRLVLRNPLDGLETVRSGPGLVGVVVVLVGSTAFDGLSRTAWWIGNVSPGVLNGTAGLAGALLLIAVVYLLGTWRLIGPGEESGAAPRQGSFAHTIVPIAAGYAIAHYFSLLVFDGQQTVILASDPFGAGANVFGTAKHVVNYTVVSTTTIALVQIGAIVLGHLLAVVSAHDRAVRLFPARAALRTQYPLLVAMVALTVGAVGLVFAP